MKKYCLVEKEELIRLLEASTIYYALTFGGVDNWSWYGDSINNYIKNFCKNNNIDLDDEKYEYFDIYDIACLMAEGYEEKYYEKLD